MDDQDRSTLRKYFLGIVFVIIIGVLVWMIFFRGDGKKPTTDRNGGTDSSQGAPNQDQEQPSSPPPTQQNNSGQPTQTGGSAAAGQTQLADAGPGDVVKLFISAGAAGGFGHYLYRRRKARYNG